MSADSVPSSKTNIFHLLSPFRTYSRCAMFDWSDTVFRRRNVTHRRISNTILQPRYWGSEADSPKVWRLQYTIIAFIWGEHRKLSTREWLFSQGHVSFLWWWCLLLNDKAYQFLFNDKAYQFLFIICIQFLWWWFDIWMFIIIFINYQLYLDYLNYCGRKTLMKALIVGRGPPRILNTCSGIGLWSHVSDVKTVVWSQHPSPPHHSGPSYHSKTVQYLM